MSTAARSQLSASGWSSRMAPKIIGSWSAEAAATTCQAAIAAACPAASLPDLLQGTETVRQTVCGGRGSHGRRQHDDQCLG